MKKSLFAFAVALAMPLAAAHADPVIGDPSCTLATDMTQSVPGSIQYLGCFGSIQNAPPIMNEGLVSYLDVNFSAYKDWKYLGESPDFADNAFKADYNSGTTGFIEFDAPLTGIYGIGLKTSGASSVYVYNFTNVSKIYFDTKGTGENRQGAPQELSHAMLYVGDGGDIDECEEGSTDPDCRQVPEPNSYALMMAGLAALGVVARRRRKNA